MDLAVNAALCIAVIIGLAHVAKRDRDEACDRAIAESRRRLECEIEAAGRRITLELWRNGVAKRNTTEPIRKACGIFSGDEAQALLK